MRPFHNFFGINFICTDPDQTAVGMTSEYFCDATITCMFKPHVLGLSVNLLNLHALEEGAVNMTYDGCTVSIGHNERFPSFILYVLVAKRSRSEIATFLLLGGVNAQIDARPITN